MELREAIEHAEQKAQDLNCSCRADHRQLAQWLQELENCIVTTEEIFHQLCKQIARADCIKAALYDNKQTNLAYEAEALSNDLEEIAAVIKNRLLTKRDDDT